MAWTEPSIAPDREGGQQRVRVTHPFNPLAGMEFDLAVRKKNWAEDRVFYVTEEGQLRSMPAAWTDVDPGDPFVVMAAGRSALRVSDLLSLASLLDALSAEHVKGTTPLM